MAKRPDWRRGFDAGTGKALHKLALRAKGNSPAQRRLRWDLIQKDKFADVLQAELDSGNLDEDITDAERSYCEGWAALARKVFTTEDDATDAKLVEAIQGEITGMTG
jgi:hypothetical protein